MNYFNIVGRLVMVFLTLALCGGIMLINDNLNRIILQNRAMIDQGDINGATMIEIRDLLKAESTRME